MKKLGVGRDFTSAAVEIVGSRGTIGTVATLVGASIREAVPPPTPLEFGRSTVARMTWPGESSGPLLAKTGMVEPTAFGVKPTALIVEMAMATFRYRLMRRTSSRRPTPAASPMPTVSSKSDPELLSGGGSTCNGGGGAKADGACGGGGAYIMLIVEPMFVGALFSSGNEWSMFGVGF